MTAPLADCHLHLQDKAFEKDLPAVLTRAAETGVGRMVCNGTQPDDWPRVAKIARENPAVFPCFGLHPWFVETAPADWESQLDSFLDSMPSAIGETGLDHHITPRHDAVQEKALRKHLAIARRRGLPVSLHCVRAQGRLLEILEEEAPLPAGFLLHAFSGPAEMVGALAKHGAYFSFGAAVLNSANTRAHAAAAMVPQDRLLVETDAPDMPPKDIPLPVAGRNEPCILPHIAAELAVLRGIPEDEMKGILWQNAGRFFNSFFRSPSTDSG